jgi:hypothetical protein
MDSSEPATPSQATSWDPNLMSQLIANHDYSHVDTLMREFLDHRRNPEAVDWMLAMARKGHVPLLYHAVRNSAKVSSGRVMGTEEFMMTFRWYIFLLLRCAQDVVALSIIHGHTARHDVFILFRDKIFSWLTSQFPVAQWPALRTIVHDVLAFDCIRDAELLPSPVWTLACSPFATAFFLRIGAHITFGNPAPVLVKACERTIVPINDERRNVTRAFAHIVEDMTWQGITSLASNIFISSGAVSDLHELTRPLQQQPSDSHNNPGTRQTPTTKPRRPTPDGDSTR